MKFTAKFLSLLTICFIANNITHIHATASDPEKKSLEESQQKEKLESKQEPIEQWSEIEVLNGVKNSELAKICDENREKFLTLLKEDMSSQVVLISIGSYVEREEDENNESREWEFQLQPYFFMQAAKNYPENKFTIIAIDPFFAEENHSIQTEKKDNLTIIKIPACIFMSYQKSFKGEEVKNEKEIFDGDISAMKDYIKKIFDRKGAIIIADIAHAMHKTIVDEFGKIMTFTGELFPTSDSLVNEKKYTTFASTDARFYCYDFFNLNDELDDENMVDTGGIVNILRIIKTKEEQFKIFDPRYANLVGDVEWHNKK